MHVPRIVKILLLLAAVYAIYQYDVPSIYLTGFSLLPSQEEGGSGSGIRLTAPAELAADSFVRAAFPGIEPMMHFGTRRDGRTVYFIYYRPIPASPDPAVKLAERRGKILRSMGGREWYLSVALRDGNYVVDLYPDVEKNALVVMVR